MASLDQDNVKRTTPNGTTNPHRRLLSNVGGNDDASADKDATTDEEIDIVTPSEDGIEANSIIGVSISHAQTHLKSPHTPAVEKFQALEDSRGYSDAEVETEEGVEDSSSSSSPDRGSPTALSKLTPPKEQRSAFTRAILGSSQGEARKRSSSGPTAIFEGLRKIFVDFPSYPGFGSSIRQDSSEAVAPTNSGKAESNNTIRSCRSKSVAQPETSQNLHHNLDSDALSQHHQSSRPGTLRRSTSDHSLYLRRATTGASEFDDMSVYANVSEMTNSRLKAITDSLADSSIKMPKLPSISFSSPLSSKANSDTTRRNTLLNSSTQGNLSAEERKDSQNSGIAHHIAPGDKKHPILQDALANVTGDLIIMGGYRGSVLRSAEAPYQQLWVPVKVGLNLRKVDLEVGLTREDEEQMEEKIVPSGILSHIGPIDIARRLLKKINKCPNVRANLLRVHDYGYDWRLSPDLLSQRLIKFLEGLQCNRTGLPQDQRGALVIAHSLGGSITRHAVNQRPELFSGVVYAGTPQNCVNILGPLRNGDDVLLSSRVLTAQVNFTFRTSYALLPEDGRCFLNKESGERYDIDFFDPNTWDEHRLSPCINPALPPSVSQARKSIVGSITESISSFAPSLPTKRSSWFSNSTSTEGQLNSSSQGIVKDTAQETKDDIESAAKATINGIRSPGEEAEDSLEPSMKSSSHKPSIATTVTIPRDKAREYLARTLAEVKQFKTDLNHIPAYQEANRYPPHAIMFGKTVPTVYGAKVASKAAIQCSDAYDNLAFAAGDGVVLASAAQLPHGYRCVRGGRVQSDRGHVGLLGDLEGIGKCIHAVVEGRKKGIGFGHSLR